MSSSDPLPEPENFVPMKVGGVVIDPNSQVPVVILRGLSEPRLYLPIFVGGLEATAIATVLADVKMPRPMTHDLLVTVLDAVACRLLGIAITRLEEGTFYAELRIVDEAGGELIIDSRPSDALALALRTKAPIIVAESVLAEAGALAPEDEGAPSPDSDSDLDGVGLLDGAVDRVLDGGDDVDAEQADDLPDMPPEPGLPGASELDPKKVRPPADGPRSFFGDVNLEELSAEDFGKYKM